MKNVKNSLLAVTLSGFAMVGATQANAKDEMPPAGALALSVLLTKLEQQGFTPIVDASLDKGHWDIEAYKEGKKWDLKVDPSSGDIIRSKVDDD